MLVIGATALAVVLPFLPLRGYPSGHDFEFHLYSWLEVLGAWKQGIFYPRWASFAHWRFGEARFVFYPPASWMLGAGLARVLPWLIVPAAYIWIALSASGASMFVLARRWLRHGDAIFAAALYAANPYHIIVIYWRSAYAELLASCLLPLLLLFVLRAQREGGRMVIPLALVVAAAWLTNDPSAVMISYSLALLLLVAAWLQRSPRILWAGVAAVALGAALAAFYLLPAAYEEKWVNIAQVLSPGVRPQDNFLFTTGTDVEHNVFNRLVSVVAVAEMIALVAAVWCSRRWRQLERDAWWILVAWAAAAGLLMFPVTLVFWDHLPKLQFVQLPWRWLLCFNVAFALLVAMGTRRWISRAALCLAMLAVIAFGWRRIQPPWWDGAADLAEMQDNMDPDDGDGHEGVDEYVPMDADPYEVNKDADFVTVEGATHTSIDVLEWGAESKLFTAKVPQPTTMVLRLFNFPAWRVEVNGHRIEAGTQELTGQMLIPVEAGTNRVRVTFIRTWDRTVGGVASLATALLIVGIFIFRPKRSPPVVATRMSGIPI